MKNPCTFFWGGNMCFENSVVGLCWVASNLTAAAAHPGGALAKAYDRKIRDNAEACREQGLVFLPMALETLGSMH